MFGVVLDGKSLAGEIEKSLKSKLYELKEKSGKFPNLATIIVGDDPPSQMYVKMKQNACERIGIKFNKIELKQSVTTEKLLKIIESLNADPTVDGILIQHPLPLHIDERECFDKICIEKDVDGVNSKNFGAMCMHKNSFVSATPLGIITLLDHYKIPLEGKHAVIVGRSPILGKPIAMMLLNKNATVTIAHSKTKNLKELLKYADMVVACVGKPKFIKSEWLKEGCIIVDAGYNKGNVGDVDLENVKEIASAYTPVPGGVGPMTIISLLQQTILAYEKKINR